MFPHSTKSTCLLLLLVALSTLVGTVLAAMQTSAFTYQRELREAGAPVVAA